MLALLASLSCVASARSAPVDGTSTGGDPGARPASVWAAPGLSSGEASDPAKPAPSIGGPRGLEGAAPVETSTGNKSLDLLLQMRSPPPEAASAPRPSASALRGLLGDLAKPAAQSHAPVPATNSVPAAEGRVFGAQDSFRQAPNSSHDVKAEWVGRAAATAGGSESRGAGMGEPDAMPDIWVLRALHDLLLFLREHRLQVLVGAGLLAVIAAGVKAYARRI